MKIGTGICVRDDGRLDGATLLGLSQQVARLRGDGLRVVLVTSGAVGLGRALLGIEGALSLADKQALAALGQPALMNAYQNIFGLLDIRVAQVLLTREDIESHERYLNARNALHALLRRGILPIVNENDSVATAEIKIGDNDHLASLVGSVVDADLVINLTSTDGLWRGDPSRDADAELLGWVDEVDEGIERLVRDDKTRHGTGGMLTKIQAARIAAAYGAHMVIAPAREPDVLTRLLRGEELGTVFAAGRRPVRGRKRWIALARRHAGVLQVDAGAARAVREQGRSLLAAGVLAVQGRFEVGALVRIEGPQGERIGRGLTNYSAEQLDRIKGLATEHHDGVLGFKGCDEVVHRDHLVVD